MLSSNQCDMAFGSRKLPESIVTHYQSIYRLFLSRLFNVFVIRFLDVPLRFTDTQCGFKIFKGDIAKRIFSVCKTEGFTFDIEIILRALKQGYKILEFPVEWSNDIDSRVQPAKISYAVFKELIKMNKFLTESAIT